MLQPRDPGFGVSLLPEPPWLRACVPCDDMRFLLNFWLPYQNRGTFLNTPYCFLQRLAIDPHHESAFDQDDSDTEPERLPCQSCGSLKQEPAVVMCDIKECRASERGWRRSCGDRGIHRAGRMQGA